MPSDREKLSALVSPNGVGKLSFFETLSLSLELTKHRCRIESDHVALVALRAHQVEHGALPATLDELVPKYLAQLPRDGFDGAPLRYDEEQRVLWTVAAGNEPPPVGEAKSGPDLAFAIPF